MSCNPFGSCIEFSDNRSNAVVIDFEVNARIVVTKIHAPDLNNSRLIRLKRILKQKGGDFQKAEKNLEEYI